MSVNFVRGLGGRCGTGSTNVWHTAASEGALSPPGLMLALVVSWAAGRTLGGGLRNARCPAPWLLFLEKSL
eukprot:7750506-Pyramimonas_sp.AAC.1